MRQPVTRMAAGMLSAVLLLTGCSSPRHVSPSSVSLRADDVMSMEDFSSAMKKEGFPVISTMNDTARNRSISSAMKADMKDRYSFSYYLLDSSKDAKSFYQMQKQEIHESYDADFSAMSESEMDGCYDYAIQTGDRYYRVICRDNAVLVVSSGRKYQNDVERILDHLDM